MDDNVDIVNVESSNEENGIGEHIINNKNNSISIENGKNEDIKIIKNNNSFNNNCSDSVSMDIAEEIKLSNDISNFGGSNFMSTNSSIQDSFEPLFNNKEIINNSNNSKIVNNDTTEYNIKKRRQTLDDLVKQDKEIKSSYKLGHFEEIINGPRGPDVRLHRHSLIVGFLKLFIILSNTAGIILLTVIMLCITINVGYVCVQIDDVNSFIQLVFFAFYFDALYYIIRSLWRTYLRALHTILDSKFGSSIDDIFIKRVLGYFFGLQISKRTMPDKYKSRPRDWYEKVNLTIFVIFLIVCCIPILLVAFIFGYWKTTGLLCLLFVCGGAVVIICLNLFSRIILYIKFFRRLDEFYYNAPFFIDINKRTKNQTSYLRLIYCSTNKLNGGENPFDYVLNLIITMIISIGLAAFIFGSFDPDVWKISIIICSLIILFPIRFRKKFHKFLVKIHILSKEKFNEEMEQNKKKINAEMDENHKVYLDSNLRSTNKPKKKWSILNFRGRNSTPNFENTESNENNSKTEINNIDETITSNENRFSSPVTSSNTIDISDNKHLSDLNYSSDVTNNDDSVNYDTLRNQNNKQRNNENDVENDSFYYLLNSNKSYVRRKALLKWDIKTVTSWKGCLTVFFCRCVKYIVGITFMALLNYYRYSVDSDEDTTNNNLISDIITHLIFVIILLGQDVLYIIPVRPGQFSMKARKILLIILIVVELILVIGMRVIITNGYIPMAFIILFYANFKVYPDPRYSWDDENIKRKTFFDLFKPNINLRSEISYRHYGTKKGFLSKNSKTTLANKVYESNNKLGKIKEKKEQSFSEYNETNDSSINDISNIIVSSPSISLSKGKGKEIDISQNEIHKNVNSLSVPNLNDTVISENDEDSTYSGKRKPSRVYFDFDGENYKIKEKKLDAKTSFKKTINNIQNEMQYKRDTRARYNSLSVLVMIFGVVLISIIIGILFSGSTELDYNSDRETNYIALPEPAICQWRADSVTINEFAALSCACYYNTIDDINYSWLYSRPMDSSNNFTIGENSIGSSSGVQYVDFINNATNTIVVAIRGTSTAEDIFQDIYIWSASALLQLSGFFGTFIKFWPRETIAGLVKFIVKQFTNLQLLYWVNVEDHIRELQEENPSTKIYITGHSLGGGISGVISAHLNLPGITFSSPGLGYSYKTYDIELKKLINNFVNVVPMSDPVPLLDSQVGQIQNIECNTDEPLSCHSIYNTIDTLNEMCHRKSYYRYWDDTEEPKFNGEEIPYKMPY